MQISKGKKAAAVLGAGAMAVAASGVAYAYWSTTGSGNGSATAASANGTVTLHASFTGANLYPGGSTSVTFTADNAGSTDLRVGTISFKDVTFTPASTGLTCDVSKFSMADVTSNTTVVHGQTGQAVTGTGTLVWANDTSTSQDGCKGGTIQLNVTSN